MFEPTTRIQQYIPLIRDLNVDPEMVIAGQKIDNLIAKMVDVDNDVAATRCFEAQNGNFQQRMPFDGD